MTKLHMEKTRTNMKISSRVKMTFCSVLPLNFIGDSRRMLKYWFTMQFLFLKILLMMTTDGFPEPLRIKKPIERLIRLII